MNTVPKFIKLKGCINCDASKSHKEKHGTDYGFDHEIIYSCLISGCMDYGYSLTKPFLDPDEALRLASQRCDATLTKQAEEYARRIKAQFHKFYEMEALQEKE